MSTQTRQSRSKSHERLLLKCKNLRADNDITKALMAAVIYVLETNPPDSEGDKGEIDTELK